MLLTHIRAVHTKMSIYSLLFMIILIKYKYPLGEGVQI